ncbi:MAG: YggT family protein [Planktomarina sp.]
MAAFYDIAIAFLGIVKLFIFAHFIMSWLLSFGVLNYHQPIVAQIWNMLSNLLEPIYAPIRRFLPNMGGVDLSPIVVLFAIFALERILQQVVFGV